MYVCVSRFVGVNRVGDGVNDWAACVNCRSCSSHQVFSSIPRSQPEIYLGIWGFFLLLLSPLSLFSFPFPFSSSQSGPSFPAKGLGSTVSYPRGLGRAQSANSRKTFWHIQSPEDMMAADVVLNVKHNCVVDVFVGICNLYADILISIHL